MITSEIVFNILDNKNQYIDNYDRRRIIRYVNKKEKLTTAVKRYFELKAKGITTEAEALEHRELLNKLYEMVGIK